MRSILFLYHYYLESILSLFYHFSITFLSQFLSLFQLSILSYAIAIQSDILEYTKNAPLVFRVYTITFLSLFQLSYISIYYRCLAYILSQFRAVVLYPLLPLQISSIGLWHCISRLYHIVFYVIAFFIFSYILCLVFSVVFMCILDARICQYAIYSLLFYNMNLL